MARTRSTSTHGLHTIQEHTSASVTMIRRFTRRLDDSRCNIHEKRTSLICLGKKVLKSYYVPVRPHVQSCYCSRSASRTSHRHHRRKNVEVVVGRCYSGWVVQNCWCCRGRIRISNVQGRSRKREPDKRSRWIGREKRRSTLTMRMNRKGQGGGGASRMRRLV